MESLSIGRETRGGILAIERYGPCGRHVACGRQAKLLASHTNEARFARVRQSLFIRRVRAPFFLTGMRDYSPELGLKQMWLWSLRGAEWVIDQELYLAGGASAATAAR